jgi:hypothetical protein
MLRDGIAVPRRFVRMPVEKPVSRQSRKVEQQRNYDSLSGCAKVSSGEKNTNTFD